MFVPNVDQHDIQQATKNINAMGTMTKEELNTEIFNKLSHRYQARAVYKKMDYELLCWTRELLGELIDEKQIDIDLQKIKDENRNNVISAMEALLAEHDFTLKELYPEVEFPEKKKRVYRQNSNGKDVGDQEKKPRRVTYKFQWTIFDHDYYWTGAGYLPCTLRCHLAKGHTIESCYLNREAWIKTEERKSLKVPMEFAEASKTLMATADRIGIPRMRKDLQIDIELNQKKLDS